MSGHHHLQRFPAAQPGEMGRERPRRFSSPRLAFWQRASVWWPFLRNISGLQPECEAPTWTRSRITLHNLTHERTMVVQLTSRSSWGRREGVVLPTHKKKQHFSSSRRTSGALNSSPDVSDEHADKRGKRNCCSFPSGRLRLASRMSVRCPVPEHVSYLYCLHSSGALNVGPRAAASEEENTGEIFAR